MRSQPVSSTNYCANPLRQTGQLADSVEFPERNATVRQFGASFGGGGQIPRRKCRFASSKLSFGGRGSSVRWIAPQLQLRIGQVEPVHDLVVLVIRRGMGIAGKGIDVAAFQVNHSPAVSIEEQVMHGIVEVMGVAGLV